jgi:O-antigen ligase
MAPAVVLLCVSEARAREVTGGLRFALAAIVLADTLGLIVFNPGMAYVRVGFLVNSNTLGLLASGLIVLSVLESHWLGTRTKSSIVCVAIGIWGLYVAHSIAGILALLSAACFLPGTTRVRWMTTALVFVAAIAAWRYGDVVGLLDASGGTLAHREAMAYAGWRLFLDAPVLGVGWQQSTASLLQSPDILASAMSRFGQLPSDYFTTRGNLGVHNAYIQLLAEMGLVGTFAVVSALVAMLTRVRRRSLLPWLPLLVAILVWHNTNPIFGGLPETALLWFTYGLAEATGASSFGVRVANTGTSLAPAFGFQRA